MSLDIQVLYTESCDSAEQVVQRIHQLAQEQGVPVAIREILVTSQEQAVELRFLGSPTVRVAGCDIDPAARTVHAYGLG
jgi:hypothetical protein